MKHEKPRFSAGVLAEEILPEGVLAEELLPEKNNESALRRNIVQFIKFTAFSASAGVIQIGVFTALDLLTPLPYWPCYLPALVTSVFYNFTVNRKFTFKLAVNVPLAMLKVALYYVVFTPASTWWGDALTKIGWNNYITLFGTMVINFVTEFLFQRFVVYGNRKAE